MFITDMRVLLINPAFPYKGADRFPLGIGYIAAIAKKYGEVRVLDLNINRSAVQDFVQDFQPDAVGITSTTPAFRAATKVVQEVRQVSSAKIIFGGVHPTFRPEDALAAGADIVVRGEGEQTFEEILIGKPLETIRGISFLRNGEVFHNPARSLMEDLDSIPFPAWDLFDLSKYPIMSIITSRGCPFTCAYCCSAAFWKRRVRFRSVDNVFSELMELHKFGVRKLKFHDSTFTLDRNRALEICNRMQQFNFRWSAETRPDCLDAELLRAMADAGCVLICIGVDSGSPAVLDQISRPISVRTTINAFRLAREAGIRTRAYVTFGLPGESRESVTRTLALLEEAQPDQIMLSLATAYPGTALDAGKKIIMPSDWIAKFDGHGAGAPLYLAENLSKTEYKELADEMWIKIKAMKRK
jgi:radical SAM superfamily enzyme YgiQ (UPF0313 family)